MFYQPCTIELSLNTIARYKAQFVKGRVYTFAGRR